jgi:hypothetical protein
MKVSTILDQIDIGSMALPEFQRGYVWNREQVRGLTHSLYRKHPVGSLLVWITKTEDADTRGDTELPPGSVKLLLDGQQRMTTLYGIVRGKPPKFFEGNKKAFTDLYFNLEDEIFEFYAPVKMKDNPFWMSVTELMQVGPGKFLQQLLGIGGMNQAKIPEYINRLNAIWSIRDIELHVEEVTGDDKTVDVVVDIFNRVNSGGTKLSKGDLALAKICASWPNAREEMKKRLDRWQANGFNFKLEWLLRNVNAIITGESLFSALKDIDANAFREGLKQAAAAIDKILTLISGRLGLDHDRVLGSRYSFPLLARYITNRGGHLDDYKERDKLLFWYIHTFLWGRYAGSTESVLAQDLNIINDGDDCLSRLIGRLRQERGDLRLQPDDFKGWSKGARFYPLMYMLTRVCKAKDLETGVELTEFILGKLSRLQVHHIFPKRLLHKEGYSKSEINAIANFTFPTQEANLIVRDRYPQEYLPAFENKHPGVLASHWIPEDSKLWKTENYIDFLNARRELLAKAANEFLESLLGGRLPDKIITPEVTEREVLTVPGAVETDEEEQLLNKCNEWVVGQSLPAGEISYELTDPDTGELLAILDLAWPNGLQERLSQPVALLIGEGEEIEQIVNRLGYLYFTDVDTFKEYVKTEILALADSLTVPKFNIISKPNEWSKTIKKTTTQSLTETKKLQLEYWTGFHNALVERKSIVKPHRPRPQQWMNFALGSSKVHLNATINTQKGWIRASIICKGSSETAKVYFSLLKKDKEAIQSEFASPLNWEELPNRKECRISIRHDVDPTKRKDWPNQHLWLAEKIETLYKIFSPRVKKIDPTEYAEESSNNADD